MCVLVVSGVIAIGAVAFAVTTVDGSDESAFRAGAFRGSEPPAGIRLPEFSLHSYRGQRVNASDLRGRVIVLTFLETRCKEACPIIARQIAHGVALLNPEQRGGIAALAISMHPRDDTSASVRRFLRRHRALGKLDYLIGSEAELRPVWQAFKVLSAVDSGDADTHSASVRVYDRNNEWVATLHAGVDLTPANLAHDIVTAERRGRG